MAAEVDDLMKFLRGMENKVKELRAIEKHLNDCGNPRSESIQLRISDLQIRIDDLHTRVLELTRSADDCTDRVLSEC